MYGHMTRKTLMQSKHRCNGLASRSQLSRAGNGTLAAAIQLKWKNIDTIKSDLEGSELTAYAIADNRTAELAEWDLEGLDLQIKDLDLELRDIAYLDYEFKDPELKSEASEKDDEVPETSENELGVKLGDVWLFGANYECEACGKVYDFDAGRKMKECPCG